MAKTSRNKGQAPAPDPHQLAAIRRLADHGDGVSARQRLVALRKSYPGFKPLFRLAWELEDIDVNPMLAAARALEWQRASPGSRAAAEAVFLSTRAAGLVALYARAIRHLGSLDGEGELPPPIDTISTPFGALTLAQAEAIDLSRVHMTDDKPADAISVLAGVDHPSARNNLALCLFMTGELGQAREVIEANWHAEPANLFAFERALRWRCWADGLAPCMQFVATLLDTTPLRPQDAIARVAALRFLGAADAALAAWEDSDAATCWQGADSDQRQMFDDLREGTTLLPGDSSLWFPAAWTRTITALARESSRGAATTWQQRWDARLDACHAHADYLGRVAELGDDAVRHMALSVLKRRAQQRDPAAASQLQTLLTRPCGPDAVRSELLHWLVAQGLRNRDERTEVWVGGRLREIRSVSLNITDEPRPSPYPPDGTVLNERMHKAMGRQALPEALALAWRLLGAYPEQPSAYTNLAAIKEALDHPAAEVSDLFRQAHALAPGNLFARCGLARCLAAEGQLEQAQTMIAGLIDLGEWHRSEYRTYLMTQRALALAGGEHEAVSVLDDSILDLQQGLTGAAGR